MPVRTWLRIGSACVVGVLVAGATAAIPVGADDLPDPRPIPALGAIVAPVEPSSRLIPVPSGCGAPDDAQAVFFGTLVVTDVATGRFDVDRVTSGTTEGFEVAGQIDIRYGDDVRFLVPGERYLVGAGVNARSGVLESKVREPAPLFGGNEIAGIDDSDVSCPVIEDPVRTLSASGSGLESGVLSPMKGSGRKVLRALLDPLAAAMAVLLVLALVKHAVFAFARALRDMASSDVARPARTRDRRHRSTTKARSSRARSRRPTRSTRTG